MRARVAIACALLPLVLATGPASASGPATRWPRGLTVMRDSPLPPRDTPTVVALGDRVLVAGGGRSGEEVVTPDTHRDGAILDLSTRRWRTISPMPFPLVAATGVWTGHEVVLLGGRPNCAAGSGCPTSTLAAEIYTVATNRWHAVTLPKRYLAPNRWSWLALHWTGSEALFSLGDAGLAIRPADRSVRAFVIPSPQSAAGECDTGSEFVFVSLEHPDPEHVHFQPFSVDRAGKHTIEGPGYAVATSASPWTATCTADAAVVASGDGTVVARYDLTTRRWSAVASLPGAQPCAVGAPACVQYRYSGHGSVLDAWIPGRATASRLAAAGSRWRDVAPGPGTDTSVALTWAGGLGITTRFDPATGRDSGELVVWRPM